MKFTLATILTLAATAAAAPTYSSYGSTGSNQYTSGSSNSNSGSGTYNSGSTGSNSGSYNSGSSNTGYSSTGSTNTGSYNSGSSNTGSYNSGTSNTGSYNSGSSNTGSTNVGTYNSGTSGSYNSGSSGTSNTGYSSTGSTNTGSYNSGTSNSASYNSGSTSRQTVQTAYCDTGSAQVSVDQVVTNGLFSILTLPLTILGLVSQCNNQILQLGTSSVTQQKQVFTQNLVAHMRQQYPSHSVIVAPHGSYSFDSTPIQKSTVSCSTTQGSSNYDVIVFDKGTFNLHGAGGFSNWAYVPNTSCQYGGNTVSC